MRESIQARLLPGEGAIDLPRLFDALERIDAAPLIAPEVFSRELADLGPAIMAARVAERLQDGARGPARVAGLTRAAGAAAGAPSVASAVPQHNIGLTSPPARSTGAARRPAIGD